MIVEDVGVAWNGLWARASPLGGKRSGDVPHSSCFLSHCTAVVCSLITLQDLFTWY